MDRKLISDPAARRQGRIIDGDDRLPANAIRREADPQIERAAVAVAAAGSKHYGVDRRGLSQIDDDPFGVIVSDPAVVARPERLAVAVA